MSSKFKAQRFFKFRRFTEIVMTNFGFSAYLKLICLSTIRQRSEIRSRLRPSNGGYDFHKNLRRLSSALLNDDLTLAQALAQADAIVRTPERNSARAGLEQLSLWRAQNRGGIIESPIASFESSEGEFSVKFAPDFTLSADGQSCAYHIWNTQRPPLTQREALGALSLFRQFYSQAPNAPNDIAVLSLRQANPLRISLSDASFVQVGLNQAQYIETIFHEVRRELGLPPAVGRGRPTAPPPPSA